MPVFLLVVMAARIRSYSCRYKTSHRHGRRPGLRRWPELRDHVHANLDAPGAAHHTSAGVNDRDVADGSDCASAPADPPKQAVTVRIIGGCNDKRCVAGTITRAIAPGVTVTEDCTECGALGFRAQITPKADTRTVEEDTTSRPGATPTGGAE